MNRVDVHEVLRDTVQLPPELRPYGRWILAAVALVVIVMAIEFPVALLAACAVGVAAGLLFRFVYCYARARDTRARNRYGSQ